MNNHIHESNLIESYITYDRMRGVLTTHLKKILFYESRINLVGHVNFNQ